jgi:plasmid maintenance system antidote protein VapI
VNKVALELHVPATRIGEIVHGRRRITAETALRLVGIPLKPINIPF